MFLETSAKTAYNVVEAFNLSALSILNNAVATQSESGVSGGNSKVLLNNSTANNKANTPKQGCC